jgi:hypothetical protein
METARRMSETERAGLGWMKSRHSTANGACIEVASTTDKIAIRDSKDPDGPILIYSPAEFKSFLHEARNGDFG